MESDEDRKKKTEREDRARQTEANREEGEEREIDM